MIKRNKSIKINKKRKTSKIKRKKASAPGDKARVAKNTQAEWRAYQELKGATERAWEKLQLDIKRKAPVHTLVEDRNALSLLLAECNYMTREYTSLEEQAKK